MKRRAKQESAATRRDDPSRRDFLERMSNVGIAAAATGMAANQANGAEPSPESLPNMLPTIVLGTNRITKLILGGNPIYGHSHFNQLYSQHLRDYHTPERVVELVRQTVAGGINTWQNSYTQRTVNDVQRCRNAGIPFHWLLLGKPDWVETPTRIDEAAAYGPLGIAPHGSSSERLHREGKLQVLRDMLKRIRQTGVLVGLSVHSPDVIRIAHDQQWDIDYYMCCLYHHSRPKDEFSRQLGEVPMGEVYLASDRERMLSVVQSVNKPCLVYKVLAAGRENLTERGIRQAFKMALTGGMKPNDALIVGMFQEFGDQVGMNAKIVRELCAG